MGGDAAVAARGDGDGERDQLARAGIQMCGLRRSAGQCGIAAKRLGGSLAEIADAPLQLGAIGGPVKHAGIL